MYAVVSTGGKQVKVEPGSEAVIERIDASVGDSVELDVLFVADGDTIQAGADAASATVKAEVIEHFLGEKVIVFKFKKRKGYKRNKGHRQSLTRIRITDIAAGTGAKKAAKKAEPAAEAKAAKPTKAEVAPEAKAEEVAAVVEVAETATTDEHATEEATAQCEAVKSNGERCTNKAKEGSKYCGVHAKKYEG